MQFPSVQHKHGWSHHEGPKQPQQMDLQEGELLEYVEVSCKHTRDGSITTKEQFLGKG